MTVEERAKNVIDKTAISGWEYDTLKKEIEQTLRDQIEDCARVADDEWKKRKECLAAAAKRNDSHSFTGHTYAMTASETIAKEIRVLGDLPDDNQPDDRFDLWGFECNEKPID